jgi:lysophospholipase L1-like esterase
MKNILLLSIAVLIGCSEKGRNECEWSTASVKAARTDGRPVLLVIGDSIALGYGPEMQESLPSYLVVNAPCNAPDSNDHAAFIDEWLSIPNLAAVTFNSGLHDATYRYNVSDQSYEANMRFVAQRIKAKTPNALFLTSTEVLPGTPAWQPGREVQLNAIAQAVMAQEGMPVFDLYSVSQSIPNEHLNSLDVHFTEAGSAVLGQAILGELFSLYGIQ